METQTLKELGLDDNFGYSYGLGFYGGGWTLDAAIVNSSSNTATALYQEQNRFTSTLNNQSFILSFGIDL